MLPLHTTGHCRANLLLPLPPTHASAPPQPPESIITLWESGHIVDRGRGTAHVPPPYNPVHPDSRMFDSITTKGTERSQRCGTTAVLAAAAALLLFRMPGNADALNRPPRISCK